MTKLTPEAMRNKIKKDSAVFMKYSSLYSISPSNLHCFFEGEDVKYYALRIERYTLNSMEDICYYDCEGKKGVLTLLEKIKKTKKWNDKNHLFFIDKDYDEVDSYKDCKEVYQTPFYSIENFYTHSDCFKMILSRELGLNAIEKDFKKAMNDYCLRHEEFQKIMAPINIWNIYQKSRSLDKKLSNKISEQEVKKYIDKITLEKIEEKENLTFEKLIDFHSNKVHSNKKLTGEEKSDLIKKLELSDVKYLEKKLNSITNLGISQNSRGKYEFIFLNDIIKDLSKKSKNDGYFSKKLVHVSLKADGNRISSLSEYAHTPPCLIEYLTYYKKNK